MRSTIAAYSPPLPSNSVSASPGCSRSTCTWRAAPGGSASALCAAQGHGAVEARLVTSRPYAKPLGGCVPSTSSISAQQRRQLAVAAGGRADVGDEARRVGQVLRLAVAQRQPREDARHLQVALQAHPLDGAVELAEVLVHRQAGLARLLPVAHRDVEHELLVPAQEGVAHQAGDVVGDGAVHRVLEVQHAQRLAAAGDHQVARHEVAVHVDAAARPGCARRSA